MKGLLYAFLGGAVVGCATAMLFAPESGRDVRERIKNVLRKKGFDFSNEDVEELVEQISAEIKD